MGYDLAIFQRLLGKNVKVVVTYGTDLSKSRLYTGQILYVSDTHLMVLDKFNKEVLISIAEIRNLEVVEAEDAK
jgi:ribosome maturation factor RimP